jgi:hypothetical protein
MAGPTKAYKKKLFGETNIGSSKLKSASYFRPKLFIFRKFLFIFSKKLF